MNEVYLLIGGNMGDRMLYLKAAEKSIGSDGIGKVITRSSIYETAAWGMQDQDAFLNRVIFISTRLSPRELLAKILRAEESNGRKREVKYGPRTIDIDILFYNNEVVDLPGLKIPHPQMQHRRFVLVPLQEIAPDKIHPVLKKDITTLLNECSDPLMVNKFS